MAPSLGFEKLLVQILKRESQISEQENEPANENLKLISGGARDVDGRRRCYFL